MSFRVKLILGIVALNLLLIAAVVFSGTHFLKKQAFADFVKQEHEIAEITAIAIAKSVHGQHKAELDGILHDIVGKHAVEAIRITDSRGNNYFYGEDKLGLINDTAASTDDFEADSNGYFKIYLPLTYHDEPVGDAVFLISNSPVIASLSIIISEFSPALLISLLTVVLISMIFSRVINRQLQHFETGALRIVNGELGYKIPVEGNDELSHAARAFNDMSQTTAALYQELELSRQRLDATINTVLDGIVTIGEDGLIRSVNKAVTDIFGYSAEELLGQNVSMLMPAPHSERHDNYLDAYMNGALPKVIGERRELSGIKKDGSEFPLELAVTEFSVAGEKLFLGSLRSMEDIYEVNEQLMQARDLHSKVLESALDAIVTVSNDGRILSLNNAAELLFGMTNKQASEHHYSDLVVFDDSLMQSVPELSGRQNLNNSIEMVAVTADGRRIPVEVSMVSIQIEDKYYINAFIRDISARKEGEQLLVSAKIAAESASRAKSDFLAVMSHEIRTPINVVLGALSILEDSGLDESQKRYFKVARESGNSLLWLVNDILDFSKIEAGKIDIDANETAPAMVVDEVVAMLYGRAEEKAIELVSAFAADFPSRVISDPARLRQILINLVGNAVKFTEQGGVMVKCECDQGHLLFHVIDTGIGIDPKRYDELFERFNQLDASSTRRFGGTGLGLAISKKLAELMGGQLTAWGEKGLGSQFTLQLPLVEAGMPVIDTGHVSPGIKLRLYDNNLISIAALRYQFEQLGVDIEVAEAIAQHAIIDVQDGERFRRFHLLGHNEPEPADTTDLYLHKPLSLKMLFSLVSSKLMEARDAFIEKRETDRERFIGQSLLLVEDSPANQLIARTMLENAGYVVDVANDGQQAIERVQQKSYALVLMDVSMPVMDGITATRIIRQLPGPSAKTIIVAMTANVFKDDIQKCYEAGMQDFIAKPIDKKRMFDVIQKNLSQTQVEPPADNLQAAANADQVKSGAVDCLNYKVLDELIRDIGMDIVPEMLRIYIGETRQREEIIRAAIISADYETLRSESHALKSSSGSVGLVTLQKQALVIEAACRQQQYDEAVIAAAGLQELVKSCLAELECYMTNLPAES